MVPICTGQCFQAGVREGVREHNQKLRCVGSRILCFPKASLNCYTATGPTTQNSQAGVRMHSKTVHHVQSRIECLPETKLHVYTATGPRTQNSQAGER